MAINRQRDIDWSPQDRESRKNEEKFLSLNNKFNQLVSALQDYAVANNDRRLDRFLQSAGFERKTEPHWSSPSGQPAETTDTAPTDTELIDELTAIVQSPNWVNLEKRGVKILQDIQQRLTTNPNEHPLLSPVAIVMRTMEPRHIANWLITRDCLAKKFGNPWSKLIP